MAMFVDERTNLHGFVEVYAHCEGCGMEYELDAESGVLRSWHDGVGQVTTTTLGGPNDWEAIVAAHENHDDDTGDVTVTSPLYLEVNR